MILNFANNTKIEKVCGSRLVGLRQQGRRPTSVTFDYYDLEKLLKAPKTVEYLLHIWTALVPDKRIEHVIK
jgi:hypothetical protein